MSRASLLAVAVIFASVSAPLAQGVNIPSPPPPSSESYVLTLAHSVIIVSGTATIELPPDVVSMNLGVSTRAETAAEALNENSAKVAQIISGLKARGVKPEQIKTSNLRLDSVEEENRPIGYEVSTSVGISTQNIAEAGAMIEAAVASGANEMYGPAFSVENEKRVQEVCLKSAFADAHAKATTLAELAKRSLGRVLAATDGSSSPFELRSFARYGEGVAGGMTLEAGMHSVECGVTVAFELK
jgi:hypothetical protein